MRAWLATTDSEEHEDWQRGLADRDTACPDTGCSKPGTLTMMAWCACFARRSSVLRFFGNSARSSGFRRD